MRANLSQNHLKEMLRFDPSTGDFTWARRPRKNTPPGGIAGSINAEGYRVIRIDGALYKAHRLVWLFSYGEWPTGVIDHINGHKADNRLENLRSVTHTVNMQNRRKAHSHSRTGILGVYPERGRFISIISNQGKKTRLGSFDTAEQAQQAYLTAKRQVHQGCTL